MAKVIVVGAGPAGMMAAIKAAEQNEVTLVDGNNRLGKKMFITGKGRCNVTNSKDISDFFDYIYGNAEFLYSSLYQYTNIDVIEFFKNNGVELKAERGGRMFPKSDKSSDVISGMKRALKSANVKILLESKVIDAKSEDNKIKYLLLQDGRKIKGDYFIFCTGGVSYPLTGSDGKGHEIIKKLGHNITKLKPSLVPIELKEDFIKDLAGLNLRNIELTLKSNNSKKYLYKDFGEILFMKYGISGPLSLKASRFIKDEETTEYTIELDLKPALTEKELDARIQKDFKKYINSDFKDSLNELLPQKLIPIIISESKIEENKKVNSITKDERKNLVNLLKCFKLHILGLRPLSEAIVTAGGVSVKEIDPSTMKSKLISNLSFAGELMDVDAFTGGYNIQIALSTGYLAGKEIN
ncbi:NAD(P)/FAD-dependent oxidoreductase [Clostridium massiliamazoniense]|uniref:NAD(P)/FAD-dependent oxidoreductase n=1 Tax=Clostridium massiliamazoniense TaxID=1347366 RepID=UPI0006D7E744|nr:NAD(P)/FAD-dependent oxidoreductase [Clostridium massiliamazoniense]